MTDLELAEEIERRGLLFVLNRLPICDLDGVASRIIAALRRGPEREGFYEKLWKDFVSLQRGDVQGILAKVEAYYRERPPSGEMVPVLREPWFSVRHIEFVCHTLPSHKEHETVAVAPSDLRGLRDTAFAWIYAYTSLGCEPNSAERMVQAEIASYLSAAEAEGRKG